MRVRFWTTERGGRLALWVSWDEDEYNVWDFPPNTSEDTITGIMHSFELGLMCAQQLAYESTRQVSVVRDREGGR